MADTFDQANENIQSQRAAMLAAMANGGTDGVRAIQSAQDQIAAQRAAAVNSALGEATARGAPTALTDQMRTTITSPYDNQIASLTASQGSRAATQAALQAANSAYFDQASAAIPALRTYAAAKAAENAQKAQQNAIDMQLKQLDLQSKQADLQAKLSGGSTLQNLSKEFGGIGNANSYLKGQTQKYVDSGAGLPTSGHGGTLEENAGDNPVDNLNARTGLPDGYLSGLGTTGKPATGKSSPTYLNASKAWVGAGPHAKAVLSFVVNGSKTPQAALDALTSGAANNWTINGKSLSGGKSLDLEQMAAWLRSYYGLA